MHSAHNTYINLSYCCQIFPWLCAWGGFAIIYSRFQIYPGKAGFSCLLLSTLYATSLSSLCRCIWRYRTYKMLVVYILSSVCLRWSQLSQLSVMQYMSLCVLSLPIFLMMTVRMCVLYLIIIIKSEVWRICHCLVLGHETMVCAVCISIFLYMSLEIS